MFLADLYNNKRLFENMSPIDLAEILFNALMQKYPEAVKRYGHEVVGDAVMNYAEDAEDIHSMSDVDIAIQEILDDLADYRGDRTNDLEPDSDAPLQENQQLSIQDLAVISDQALDAAYGYGRSSPGNTFGWQANLQSAAYAKKVIDAGVTDIETIADAIHKGWNQTAKAFVSNPDQFSDTEKLKAAGKLEAKLQQRAKLMQIDYAALPEDEKEKDRVVARVLLQAIKGQNPVTENLRKWFKEKWVRFGPDGKIRGACARGDESEGKPKCLPQAKAHALGKKGRKYAAAKKRREDPDPERRGPAKNVATKKKSNEGVAEAQSAKTGIYQTDVMGAKAYHAKCLEPNCNWESKRFDKIKQAQAAAEKHAKGHFKQGVAEGHDDQQRKIFKRNGQPVGEVGIDRESSPGVGQWYMKCYAYDIDNSGYDSYEEAVAELKHCLKQGVAEGRFDEPLTGWHIVYRKSGNPVHATPSFETKDQAQKYLMTRMFANHQDYKVVHTAGVGVTEGKMAELYMDLEDSEISDKQFEKMYGMTRKEAREQFSQTDMWAFPEIRDPNKPLHEQGVAEGKRIARKSGQPANSKEHSDLYTDENPKGTIHGLKFATIEDAKASVNKIKTSGKSHAHKIQAAVAMEQRAKAAGKSQAADVYRKFINFMKKKTNKAELNEACWKGYHKEGMKTMFGKQYPNCVKNKKMSEGQYRANDIEEFKPDDQALDDIKSKFLPDWQMLDHRELKAVYVAKDHRRAQAFTEYINNLCEEMDHFAEVTQDVSEVTVKTTTSDVKGLTILDFQLAMQIDQYAEENKIDQLPDPGNFAMQEKTMCPECGGPAFSDLILAEKQDACYHKVKSRYKVWPSAYASGALVQCRKKGAANWGKKKTNEAKESPAQDYQKMMNFVQAQRLSGVPPEQQVAVALFKELEKTKAFNKELDAELKAAGERADIGAEQGELATKELGKHRGELEKEKQKQQASRQQLQALSQQLEQLKTAPNVDTEASQAIEQQIAELEQKMQDRQGTGVSADKISELEQAIANIQQGETVDADAIQRLEQQFKAAEIAAQTAKEKVGQVKDYESQIAKLNAEVDELTAEINKGEKQIADIQGALANRVEPSVQKVDKLEPIVAGLDKMRRIMQTQQDQELAAARQAYVAQQQAQPEPVQLELPVNQQQELPLDTPQYRQTTETRFYFSPKATLAETLRSDFAMTQDSEGWYLTAAQGPAKLLEAQRAFGIPKVKQVKLKEVRISDYTGRAGTIGDENATSPIGSLPRQGRRPA